MPAATALVPDAQGAPPSAAAPPRLAAKLARIMGTIDNVQKNGYNDFHKYAFAKEGDVAAAVRHLLANENIAITPEVGKYEVRDISGGKEKVKLLAIVEVIFTIRDGDSDESIRLPWLGTGEDAGDKCVYKAFTGAEKFLLLKLFLIPTGDDPEASDGAGQPTSRGQARRQERQGKPQTSQGSEPPREFKANPTDTRVITDPQVKRLGTVMKIHNVDAKSFQALVKTKFGYATSQTIQRKDYDAIVKAAEAGGQFLDDDAAEA